MNDSTVTPSTTEDRDQWRARILRALTELRGDSLRPKSREGEQDHGASATHHR